MTSLFIQLVFENPSNLTKALFPFRLTTFSTRYVCGKRAFHDFSVTVSEHSNLNSTQGIVYSNDLRGIQEDEILRELSTQKLTKVKKILKFIDNKPS